jgi:hypothetical protein
MSGWVREQAMFMQDVCKLIAYATSQGFFVTGGELFRPLEMQEIYIKTGRSKTMNSMHLKRAAIDLNFFRDGKLIYDREVLRPIGTFWESLDPKNQWGGNWKSFKDVPHFERRF